ncbi:hypothetical protein GCM10007235_11160 [Pseudoxanthomonas indica]|nr:hypothetical protein GCM10007235_11160 [Pseudoxanthomonas indica]
MSYVSIEELELLSFFEVEPSRADLDVPWPYNELTYQISLGQHMVSFIISPSYRDLSLSVTHDGTLIYSFRGSSIKDVRYHKDADVETLEIVVSDRDTIWLSLRPSVVITQDAGKA